MFEISSVTLKFFGKSQIYRQIYQLLLLVETVKIQTGNAYDGT